MPDSDKFSVIMKFAGNFDVATLLLEMEGQFQSGDYEAILKNIDRLYEIVPGHMAIDYYAAMINDRFGNNDKAYEHMAATEFAPGADQDLLTIFQYILWQDQFAREHASAIARGVPTFACVALPKSASAAVSYFLGDFLSAPVARTTYFGRVIGRWANALAKGGAVTHEHTEPTNENLKALVDSGIERIAVQIRDPRQAFFSSLHASQRKARSFAESNQQTNEDLRLLNEEIETLAWEKIPTYVGMVSWIYDWVKVIDGGTEKLTIKLLSYDEFTNNPQAFFQSVLEFFGAEFSPHDLEYRLERLGSGVDSWDNFREGDPDAWRNNLSPGLCAELWERIPKSLRQEFAFQK